MRKRTEEKQMRRGRLIEFTDRNREKVWFSFALNFLVLAVMLLLMTPSFETNDDTTLREFVNGAREHASPCLLFQNWVLGLIYRLLYRLPGNIPWYSAVQYAVLFLSFTAITYVVLKKLRGAAGFCVASILLFYFAREGYVSVQFTKTAGIAMCAGIFLLFYAVEAGERISEERISGTGASRRRISRGAAVCGILLGCAGSMYRFKQSVACAALMTGIGLFVLLKSVRENPKDRLRGFRPYLTIFVLFGACVLGLFAADQYAYHRNPRWREYAALNELRSDLMDYGIPNFDSNEEAYAALGINRDAYLLLTRWSYNDPDTFSPKTLEAIRELQPKREFSLALVRNFLNEFPARFFQTYTFYAFLLLGVLWIFCGYHRREDILAVLYEIALFGLLYFYTYFSGRYAVNRVDVGLWLALSLTAVWFLDTGRMKLSRQQAGAFCLCLLLLNQYNWKDYWRVYHVQDAAVRENTRAFAEEMAKDQEHLYLVKVGLMSTFSAYGIFERTPRGILNNMSLLGGWDCDIPEVQDITASYGVTNPYRDAVDNPSVYIVDDRIDLTVSYIQAYYAPDAKAVPIRELAGRKIYQIVTE